MLAQMLIIMLMMCGVIVSYGDVTSCGNEMLYWHTYMLMLKSLPFPNIPVTAYIYHHVQCSALAVCYRTHPQNKVAVFNRQYVANL